MTPITEQKSPNFKQYFKSKKVTIMGLGLLGKGLGDAVFLAKAGALVTVTDLKTEEELASSVLPLKKYKNVRFVLGKHDFADFENADMILKAQGVRLDSLYIAHARARNIPIRMDDELFLELAPKIQTVGVTGTRGKTTTSTLIYEILKKAGKRVHLAGNIRGVATLGLLNTVAPGDIVVLELSSWQLQGFGERKVSPDIAVFTNFMPDHMNYYDNNLKTYFADKAYIFKNQNAAGMLVVGESMQKKIPKSYKGTLVVAHRVHVPKAWNVTLPGDHNRENIALAVAACRALKVPLTEIRKAVESFKAVTGRLEYMKAVRGIKIYNDNNATTPEATTVALRSFTPGSIVLITGGADKGLDTKGLLKEIKRTCKAVILLPGSGSDKLVLPNAVRAASLQEAMALAQKAAHKGDLILFSPGFASFGMFTNEYDRNDQFVEIVKKLK